MLVYSIIPLLGVVFIYLLIRKKSLSAYKVWPLFVIVGANFLAELGALLLQNNHVKGGSVWVYNISIPGEAICYGFLFRKIFNNLLLRYFISLSIMLIPCIALSCFFYYKSIFIFYTPVLTAESIFLLIVTLIFFVKLFRADYFNTNPLKQFFFWLCTGLLFCYLGSFMFLSNLNYLFLKFRFLYDNLKYLNFILNCFLYLCIIISVECLRRYPSSQIQSF